MKRSLSNMREGATNPIAQQLLEQEERLEAEQRLQQVQESQERLINWMYQLNISSSDLTHVPPQERNALSCLARNPEEDVLAQNFGKLAISHHAEPIHQSAPYLSQHQIPSNHNNNNNGNDSHTNNNAHNSGNENNGNHTNNSINNNHNSHDNQERVKRLRFDMR